MSEVFERINSAIKRVNEGVCDNVTGLCQSGKYFSQHLVISISVSVLFGYNPGGIFTVT